MALGKLFDRFRGKPTRESFARSLIDGLREAGDTTEYRYEPEVDRIIRLEDGKPSGAINLGNMFPIYLAASASERNEYLQVCIRTALLHNRELPKEFDLARADIRPRVWSRAAREKERLRALLGDGGMNPSETPSVPIGEHLVVTLCYDWPEAVQSIAQSNLDDWGVTLYEGMEVALANLLEATEGYAQAGDGFYAFVSGDSYDATRLMLTDYIGRMEVKGSYVAMAARRDELMITGSEDEAGLKMMSELGEASLSEPYALSAVPLILEDGVWVDWLPPEGHPLRRRFLDIRMNWLGPEYTEQKQLLDALHAQQGTDVFLANISAVERKDGKTVSYCVWAEGVETLLPEADKVVLMNEAKEIAALAPWDRVREVVEHLMEPTEFYPMRWRVKAFPEQAEIEALGMGEM